MPDYSSAISDINQALQDNAQQAPISVPPPTDRHAAAMADIQAGLSTPEVAGPPQPPAKKQELYTGQIGPFNQDEQGNLHWDWNAGVIGGIKRLFEAAKAPYDVYTGKLPTPYSGGPAQATPELLNRAADFALAFGPTSAALRAGEIIPGEALRAAPSPSVQQLKSAADTGYAAARASPITVPGEAIADMAGRVKDTLQNEYGIIPKTAPKTHAILDELLTPPAATGPNDAVFGTYTGLEAARRGLNTLRAGNDATEALAASKAIPELDNFIDTISPEARLARANLAAAKRSNELVGGLSRANTGIAEQAEARSHASHSGMNMDNALRARVASFLQAPENVLGYSTPEIEALNQFVEGSKTRNAARWVGNYFGGGGGLGSLAAGMAGGAIGNYLLPGYEGTALGAMFPTATGVSAKAFENNLARRSLNNIAEQVRMRSPLGEATQNLMLPATGRNNAYLRGSAFMPTLQPTPPTLSQIMAQPGPNG